MNIPWWGYVIGAGLAWGTYVPLVFFGGTELTTSVSASRTSCSPSSSPSC